MSDQMELQRAETQAVATTRSAPSVGEMLAAVVQGVTEKGLTAENAMVMEKLMGLYERAEARQAEKDFNAAFVRFKSICPKVHAVQPVLNRDGTVRYKFAPIERIDEQIKPSLEACGLAYSFGEKVTEGNRKVETCTIMHVGGHSRTNEFAVRVGSGPPGCTETQADGAAGQYARRYALCDALGIVIEKIDQDARLEGGPITRDQAEELARRVNETNSDREKFLKLAGTDNFFTIPAAKYDMLDDMLRRKEARGR